MKRIAPTTIIVLIVLAALLPRPLVAQQGEFQEYSKPAAKPDWLSETIDQASINAGWIPLRKASLPSDSFEVRIWIVGALASVRRDSSQAEKPFYAYRTFTIRRDASLWTARYVEKSGAFVRSVEPRSQWHALWAKLVALGLLTLPDSALLRDPVRVMDGVVYVVEINATDQYRTYSYSNPKYQKWPEAKQLLQIVATLETELLPKPWDLRWWWWSA